MYFLSNAQIILQSFYWNIFTQISNPPLPIWAYLENGSSVLRNFWALYSSNVWKKYAPLQTCLKTQIIIYEKSRMINRKDKIEVNKR